MRKYEHRFYKKKKCNLKKKERLFIFYFYSNYHQYFTAKVKIILRMYTSKRSNFHSVKKYRRITKQCFFQGVVLFQSYPPIC